MIRTARSLAAIAALVVSSAPAVLSAQEALPPAQEIVARHVAAIGGRDALMRHNTIRSTGSFEMPAAGLKGDLKVIQARDGRTAMTINVPGIGEMATGYDGTTAWSMNPMQGPRVLDGPELTQLRDEGGFLSILRASPSIESMETVERSTIGGEACYKVKVTFKSGRVTHDCYSIETGLLAGTIAVQESNMGSIELTSVVTDWKEFDGVKFATRMRQQAMGQEQVMTIDSIVFDDPADADAFQLPEPVRAITIQKDRP